MSLALDLAGLDVELSLPDGPLFRRLVEGFAPFRREAPSSSALRLEVRVDGRRTPHFAPGTRPLPDVRVETDGALRIEGGGFSARIEASRRQGSLEQGDESFPVDSVLKLLLADFLLARGGLLLHGVSLARAGRAALFVGHSGAGKSTLGRCATETGRLQLLSDELEAVLPLSDGGHEVRATPWNVGRPARAELVVLGVLAWSPGHGVEPCAPAEVLRMLLPNALLADPSADGRARVFRAASALLRQVPSVRLSFAPDAGVGEVLASALEPR